MTNRKKLALFSPSHERHRERPEERKKQSSLKYSGLVGVFKSKSSQFKGGSSQFKFVPFYLFGALPNRARKANVLYAAQRTGWVAAAGWMGRTTIWVTEGAGILLCVGVQMVGWCMLPLYVERFRFNSRGV